MSRPRPTPLPNEPDLHGFLPGCYRNFGPIRGESFAGFMLRLAGANGYAGIRDLLRARNLATNRPLGDDLLSARSSVHALADIGRMAVGDPDALRKYQVVIHPDDSIFFRECRIVREALLDQRASVCSACLALHGWASEEWDLTPVTACPSHFVVLRDECDACGHPISWGRRALLQCDKCGADLREQPSRAAESGAIEVSEDFAALAPFRIEIQGGLIGNGTWDEMFHVFKALLLPNATWAHGQWDGLAIFDLPVRIRHTATLALDAIRHRRCYRLPGLAPMGAQALRPLCAVPRQGLVQKQAYDLLMQPGGLSNEVAIALSGHEGEAESRAGAALFAGRPPSLSSHRDVAEFLGVDLEMVSALRELRAIPSHSAQDVGLDIDRLLATRKFLREGLLDLGELGAIVGVPVQAEDLSDAGLLPRWNPRNKSDWRVQLDIVVALHMQLTAYWHETHCLSTSVRVGELTRGDPYPYRTVAATVSLILNREVAIVAWSSPFTWAAIEVDVPGGDLILRRITPPRVLNNDRRGSSGQRSSVTLGSIVGTHP
jgi:hypothetical protein